MKALRLVLLAFGICRIAAAGSNTWTGGFPGSRVFPLTTVIATDPSNPSVVYATFDLDLYRSADGGRSWTRLSTLSGYVLSLFVSPASASVVFAGTDSGLLRSADGGVTWKRVVDDPITVLAAQPSDSSVLYAGSARGAVWRGANDGAAFNVSGRVPSSDWFEIASLLFPNRDDGQLYAAGGYDLLDDLDYGYGISWSIVLSKSSDLGTTWTDTSESFSTHEHLNEYVSDLVAGSQPNELFTAMGNTTSGARLAHSTDSGATWDRDYLRSLPGGEGIHRLAVDPERPGTLYAGTTGGIYRSTDDGQNWLPFGQSLRDIDISGLVLSGQTLHAATAFGEYDLDLREGAVDVSAGTAGTHLLLWNADRLSVHTLPESGDPSDTPYEGPFGTWAAVAIADGPDGKSRVLWVNGDGRATLEIVGAAGSEAVSRYPAISQWAAIDVAAASVGGATILWTSARGEMSLASIGFTGSVAMGPTYGPYFGWSAVAVASRTDASTWVLWRCSDGRSGMTQHRAGELEAALRFDASPGWAAEDLTVGIDGRPRLLRVNSDGRAEVSTVDTQGRLTDAQVHTNPGFAPRRIAAGPDGLTRLLWGSDDGRDSVTLLSADNTPPADSPPSQPSSADLTGSWTGTLGLSEPCADRTLGKTCRIPDEVKASLSQSGSAVIGRLTGGCGGAMDIQGTNHSGHVALDLVLANGTAIAVSGSADSQSFRADSLDLCNPWNYDSTLSLQLSRSEP
jgi:photosystem II stability/assembly factor-like uncharacterized protein